MNVLLSGAALVKMMVQCNPGLFYPKFYVKKVNNLMCFIQEMGRPLCLNYANIPYGPRCESVRHVFCVIEGHMVSGHADVGDVKKGLPELALGEEAGRFLSVSSDMCANLERASGTVDGIDSLKGLRAWMITGAGVCVDDATIVARSHALSKRKEQVAQRKNDITLNAFRTHGWIEGTAV